MEDDQSSWTEYFSGKTKQKKARDNFEYEEEKKDPRPRIYLGIFGVILGAGLLESFWLSRQKKMKDLQNVE